MQNKRHLVAISMASLMAIALFLLPMPVSNAATGAIPIASNPITQYPWPQVGHDPQCTSFSPGPGPKTNHLLWKRDLGFEVGNIVVWKGKVHAPTSGKIEWCLDAHTGNTIWTITDPEFGSGTSVILQTVDSYGIYSQYDLVVRSAGSDRLVAYAEPTGEVVWTYKGVGVSSKGNLMTYRDPMGGTGTEWVSQAHIVCSTNSGYSSWDHNGKLEWEVGRLLGERQAAAGKEINAQYGPLAIGELKYVGGPCGCTVPIAFPSPDGKTMWVGGAHGKLSHVCSYVPSLYRDQNYPKLPKCNYTDNELLKRVGGYAVVVNGSNGNFLWGIQQQTDNCNSAMFADGKIFTGSTWAGVGKMYCGIMGLIWEPAPPGSAMPGWLWCYDAYAGKQLWEWTQEAVGLATATPSPMTVYMNGKIYIGSYADEVFCLNPNTAQVIWWRESMGAMGGRNNGPIGADGIIYAGGGPWRVYGAATSIALDAETGETIWSYQTPGAQKHQGAVADGIWYVPTGDGWLYAFGDGPTKTSLELSTKQLKAGDTVLISGQVLDQSPASPNAPVANVPVTLMYAPLGSVDIKTITTATTSYSGDYYYEWTVPEDVSGMYSIVVSYAGTPGYKASSATLNFKSGQGGFTQAELNQIAATIPAPTFPDYTPLFYAVIALAAIAIVVSVYAVLLIKKQQK